MAADRVGAALDRLLPRVAKPTRYLGGEWNSVVKDPGSVDVRMALAFPDVYEIGMSHLGFRILYALVNRIPWAAAERVFMPWVDMLELLREHRLPLVTLETRTPLAELDLVGFSLQHELALTNMLAMLDLGGIPLLARERGPGDPLVLAGGPLAFHPEPWAPFVDLVLAGDAEEALPELLARARELRRAGAGRDDLVRELARLPGWYAPALYETREEPAAGLLVPRPRPGEDVPPRVKRRVLLDLDAFPFPEAIVVPHQEIVHDRVSFEIMRGCPVGCRFCQAGFVYRPTRERAATRVIEGVRRSIEATGWDEFSLTSLNSGEYSAIAPLLTTLMDEMEPRRVSVGLSSLHATTLTRELAEQVRRVRKTGFTIAPEAGTQRLRDAINKNLAEEQILAAARRAFEAGWSLVKLYFMIGLPTETDEDVDALVDLAGRIAEEGRRVHGKKARVTLSASTFVPKPFTPFQWCPMIPEERTRELQARIRRRLPRGVQFRHHDPGASWLEGVLSRADRRFAPAILAAYRRGAILDGWTEHLRLDAWREAFAEHGIDPDAWATREIPLAAELPWEVIDPLVRREWLAEEYRKALAGETVEPCGEDACTRCAPFAVHCVRGIVAEGRRANAAWAAASREERREPSPSPAGDEAPPPPVYRWRARFAKEGPARFLGHLDLVRAIVMGFRRAGIQPGYTHGFKPRPKVALSPALGLGIASRDEYIDFETTAPLEPAEVLERLGRAMPEGIRFLALVPLDQGVPALQDAIARAVYEADVPGLSREELEGRVRVFLARDRHEIRRTRKGKTRVLDVRPLVESAGVTGEGRLRFAQVLRKEGTARPTEILAAILGGEEDAAGASLVRTGLLARVGDRLVSPLLAARRRRGAR